jgi:hypothetical protein
MNITDNLRDTEQKPRGFDHYTAPLGGTGRRRLKQVVLEESGSQTLHHKINVSPGMRPQRVHNRHTMAH